MHELSPDAVRAEQFAELREEPLDVLVIGGGIVGAGVARDAAMRGLRTGLVEKHDLAFGTSSRSSRLLHGGLRYLAQGRLGLVYEASREKMILHAIAPHLAEPLPFLFPTYRGTPWPRWKLAVGVKLYDLLCGRRNLGRSETLGPGSRLRTAAGHSQAEADRGRPLFRRFDQRCPAGAGHARFGRPAGGDRAELCGIAGCHGRWPYVAMPRPQQCALWSGGEELLLTARCVVNAAGPWAAAIPHSRLRLRLTKGVHLVIDRQRLPLPCAVVMTAGPRILFGIPWGQRMILGTTDTDYEGPPEAVTTDEADIAYILEIVNANFPAAALTPADVIRTWAGLRPLIDTGQGRGGRRTFPAPIRSACRSPAGSTWPAAS